MSKKPETIRALKIPADRDKPMEIITLQNANDYYLQALQEIVGGFIERVAIGDCRTHRRWTEIIMFVDDEGSFKPGYDVNPRASILYGSPVHGSVIYGDVVITGETIGIEGAECSDLNEYYSVGFFETYLGEFLGRGVSGH